MGEPVFAIVEDDGEGFLYIGDSLKEIQKIAYGQPKKVNLPWYEILNRISDSPEFSSLQYYFINEGYNKDCAVVVYEWDPLTETPFEENELEKIINEKENL